MILVEVARGSAFQIMYSFRPLPCQKQYPGSFLWTETDGEIERGVGGGGVDKISSLSFSYIFIYLDLISDLDVMEASDAHLQSEAACRRCGQGGKFRREAH